MSLQDLANLSQIGRTGLWGSLTGYQYEFFLSWNVDTTFLIQIDIKWNKDPLNPINITSSELRYLSSDGSESEVIVLPFLEATYILGILLPLMCQKRVLCCGYISQYPQYPNIFVATPGPNVCVTTPSITTPSINIVEFSTKTNKKFIFGPTGINVVQ